MVQIIEQSHDEKVKMYSKLTKKELIEMLIEANRVLEFLPIGGTYHPSPTIAPDPLYGYKVICETATATVTSTSL